LTRIMSGTMSVTTFRTFLREFSSPSSHCRRPPHIRVDCNSGLGVSGCRVEVPVAVSSLRCRPRAQIGYGHSNSSSPLSSVQVCGPQLAGSAVTLPIHFRSCLACLSPGGLEFLWDALSGLEVHLIRRLPTERGVR
jgi:hypothetical protein